MAKCKNILKARKMLCVSGLKTSLTIYDRHQVAPGLDGAHSEEYVNPRPVMAQVETRGKGIELFSQVTQDYATISHVVTIRFIRNITSENWVQFHGLNFDIFKVENIDEESRYLRLYCMAAGSVSKAGAR